MPKKSQKNGVKKMNGIQPLGDRVLVRPMSMGDLRQASGKKSSFGIILPDSIKEEKSAQGTVLAVGPGKYVEGKLVGVNLKPGDTVIFSKYAYDAVEQNGEELYLLKEDNILAVIK